MAKTTLGKSSLQKEKQQLKLYLKLLPSLDLKRTQLMAEQTKASSEMVNLKKEAEETMNETEENLPMLANPDVQLEGLLKIKSVVMGEESVVGVKVPSLKEITFEVIDYSMLATPPWIEEYIKELKKAIEIKMRAKVMGLREDKLRQVVRRTTQHVNLFEKILIPTAKKNIRKIQILLGERERSAVVRSKLAKALHKRQAETDLSMDTGS